MAGTALSTEQLLREADADTYEESEDQSSLVACGKEEKFCLIYDSFLAHQRYFDDFKHANHEGISYNFGASRHLVIEQDARLGKGGFCWDAGFSLAEHLLGTRDEWLRPYLEAGRRPRVLEVGAGTGLTGLAVAQNCESDVTLTDVPELLPLLDTNVLNNCLGEGLENFSTSSGTAKVAKLSWGEEADISALLSLNGPFDVILAADCVCSIYDTKSLTDTIAQLSGPHTRVYTMMKTRYGGQDEHLEAFVEQLSAQFFEVAVVVPKSRNRNPAIRLCIAHERVF